MGWGAAIGAAISYFGSKDAAGAAKKKGKLADQALLLQMELARRQGEISEEQYQFWLENYRPLALEAIAEARKEVVPDYAAIQADNAGAYQAQKGSLIRSAQRYGVNPQDGGFGTGIARIAGDEAKSLVFNRNRAREGAKGQQLANLMGAYGMGSGMPGLAASTAASAGAGFGNAAGAYGAGAQNAYNQAAQDAAGWGQLVGSIPWGQIWNGVSGGGNSGASTPSNSVGPTAGGYTYPAPAGGQPGPWAGGFNYTSSREKKYGVSQVDPEDALDDVNNTPLAKYAYNGTNDQMVGTIAEEAPDSISNGKQVNLINQVGTLTGAVQALSQRQTGKKPRRVSQQSMSRPMKDPGAYAKPAGPDFGLDPSGGYGVGAMQTGSIPEGMGPYAKRTGPNGEDLPRRTPRQWVADQFVPDRNRDGRRSGREFLQAAGDGVLNYATGGLYGVGRRLVNAVRNRGDRLIPGVEAPVTQYRTPAQRESDRTSRAAMDSTRDAVRRANEANRPQGYDTGYVQRQTMERMAQQGRSAVDEWRSRNIQ